MNSRLLLVLVGLALATFLAPGQTGGQTPPAKDDAIKEAKEAAFRKQAEVAFKARDLDMDGYLDREEVSEDLRANFSKYDQNGDGRISFEEYLTYKRELLQPPPPPMPPPANIPMVIPPKIIIDDDSDLERRPTVYRIGNLPKGLPAWFEKLDVDEDGQVALWEWRKAGKTIKEFSLWDRNDDGLITIEEVMYKLEQERLAAKRSGKPLLVGPGLEYRETMLDGAVSVYFVKFEKGITYQIDMMTSTPQTIDPFLYIYDHEGREIARDDDSGGQLNARILYKSSGGRNVRIVASSVGNRGNGDYILTVRQKDLPMPPLTEGKSP